MSNIMGITSIERTMEQIEMGTESYRSLHKYIHFVDKY